LQTSSVINRRTQKADSAKAFLDRNKEEKDLRKIYTGASEVQNITVSPDERFVTYRLYQKNDDAQGTIVPAYVTKEGYTKDIAARSKAGRPDGKYSSFVFDRLKDTVLQILTDSIQGIADEPEYLKDYPAKKKDSTKQPRKVYIEGPYWNDDGSAAVVDVFSLDNKDRWIMQLDAATAKLSLLDRQHDEAWIAGPGIAWLEPAKLGWLNAGTFYFQSEATGYSHLYAYNIKTHRRSAITQGNYEIQNAVLSHDKKYFFVLTNEENPGKQNIYRTDVDGTNKIKLTSFTGGYEMFLSPDDNLVAYRYSYQNKPWELYVQSTQLNSRPVQVTDKGDELMRLKPTHGEMQRSSLSPHGMVHRCYARVYEPKAEQKTMRL
jgi:dipeptidyl aminopeptidase/acylaminoacyl peptidase